MHLVASVCCVLTSLLPCFKVKVRVKVTGQGQISGAQLSILGARLCKAKKNHYQLMVFVFVSNNCADAVDRHLFSLQWKFYLSLIIVFVTGLWNQIFLCSNLALFILIPFAYLFTESEGFPGSKRVCYHLFFLSFFSGRGMWDAGVWGSWYFCVQTWLSSYRFHLRICSLDLKGFLVQKGYVTIFFWLGVGGCGGKRELIFLCPNLVCTLVHNLRGSLTYLWISGTPWIKILHHNYFVSMFIPNSYIYVGCWDQK